MVLISKPLAFRLFSTWLDQPNVDMEKRRGLLIDHGMIGKMTYKIIQGNNTKKAVISARLQLMFGASI